MKNIKQNRNNGIFTNKKGLALFVLSVVIVVLVASNVFLTNQSQTSSDSSGNNPLHQKLLSMYNSLPTQPGKTNFLKQSNNLTKNVDPELVDLDSQIITCGATVDSLLSTSPSYAGSCVSQGGTLSSTKGMYLGGQCCGTLMDTNGYHENLKKLQAYKNMPDVILDPMHTPITLAKKWIDYDNSTTLTVDEQKIFDDAYAISKEKPCCCKCWHYYTNEGIAKKMIKDGTYNSKQIADFWDASEICGV